MPRIFVHCDSVPAGVVLLLSRCIANDNLAQFVSLAVDFGHDLAPLLMRGVKIATGNDVRGFHDIDITLRGKVERITNIGISEEVEIADIPTYNKLLLVSRLMGHNTPDFAMGRIIYWMWVAAQYLSMYLPIFIMDHERGEWYEYKFRPLLDARDAFMF